MTELANEGAGWMTRRIYDEVWARTELARLKDVL